MRYPMRRSRQITYRERALDKTTSRIGEQHTRSDNGTYVEVAPTPEAVLVRDTLVNTRHQTT